jgi:hypothetical protein
MQYPITTPIYSNKKAVSPEVWFWDSIDKLGWKNKSEGEVADVRDKFLLVIGNRIPEFMNMLEDRMIELDKKIAETQIYNNSIFPDQKRSFLSHIVGKGKKFYNIIYADPSFAYSLIWDDNYEFRDFISSISPQS